MPYTLVIVDMQTGFYSSWVARRGVRRAVINAARSGHPIINVVYDASGPIIPSLTRLLSSYDNHYWLEKTTDSGAAEVDDLIRSQNLPNEIKICGVNTRHCVASTALGLHRKGYPVVLLKDACWDSDAEAHAKGVTMISQTLKTQSFLGVAPA